MGDMCAIQHEDLSLDMLNPSKKSGVAAGFYNPGAGESGEEMADLGSGKPFQLKWQTPGWARDPATKIQKRALRLTFGLHKTHS